MNTDMMTNEDGDYVSGGAVQLDKDRDQLSDEISDQLSEVFFRTKSTANSPKSAKYTKINKNKYKSSASPAETVASPLEVSDNISKSSSKKHIIKSKPHSPAAGEMGVPLLDKLLLQYSKELSSGTPGVTKVCNYAGLQGLASSYHALPQQLRDICKLPTQARTRLQEDALAAYGYQVLMGKA